MHTKQYVTKGKELSADSKVIIMIHGRGANAEDILSLANYLPIQEFTLIAPQATNHTWYPYSFMAPVFQNEPWLSSALNLLNDLLNDITSTGVKKENIYFLGFSQGACLTLEFTARNASGFGGVIAFTGGLIGDTVNPENYKGDYQNTPVFIGTSDPDPHVPVSRVNESETILKSMHADVLVKVYKGMGHTINQDEIDQAIKHVLSK